jgi:acyl carrier protein
MDIQSTIESFIVEEILLESEGGQIDYDQSLISSGILDSLGLLRLIGFIEDRFGIKVEDGEVIPENFESIKVMREFLATKLKNS